MTSGAKADLQHTTRVAREMVYKLGMGPGTGLVAFDERESGGAVSAELHAAMDRDVRLIVELLYARVREAIELHRTALEALAEALLERETLEGAEALSILQTHGVTMEDPLRRRAVDDRLRGARAGAGSAAPDRRGARGAVRPLPNAPGRSPGNCARSPACGLTRRPLPRSTTTSAALRVIRLEALQRPQIAPPRRRPVEQIQRPSGDQRG